MIHGLMLEEERQSHAWETLVERALERDREGVPEVDLAEPAIGQHEIAEPTLETAELDGPDLDG